MAIKKSNKIKVSEATVQKLRKGTMAGNLAKAKGASPEMREALIRFYGVKRVTAAIGKTGPGSVKKPAPFTPKPNTREDRKPGLGSPKPSGGPGSKPRPARPSGGPGSRPLPKKPVTPNGREDRRSVPSVKPGGGPGAKPRPARPSGGPGSKPRPSKGQTPNQREGRRSVPTIKRSGGPGAKPRTKSYKMNPGG